jgi:pimeloyl-ACP methyl ester carboxylesterase/predicted glycosyltransferase
MGPAEEQREPARSRLDRPHRTGTALHDGVRLAWRLWERDAPTVVLMPTWALVDSRQWKLQVPYLARHFRLVTFDGRGSGASSRPAGAEAYADRVQADDALAVLDATGTERATLVALSAGVPWAIHLAADHPDRVAGLVALAASPALGGHPHRRALPWDQQLPASAGWASYNRRHWLEDGLTYFRHFFLGEALSEPHSTRALEDALAWSAEVPPQVLVDATAARHGLDGAAGTDVVEACGRVRCPVLVVHGTEDRVQPPQVGERLAGLTGGTLELMAGSGHLPHLRDPVHVNQLLKEFVDMQSPAPRRRTWVRAQSRPRRALYLSSPIGLGHARRDLAIARELRTHHPDLQVDWLAQHPVTRLLDDAGERVHPASAWLANESSHIEDEADEHDLHAFQAIRRMDEILVHNFMVFQEVVESGNYDLVIGDEAWEVDHFLHENPELKRFAFAWMTDFVGWLPMPDGGAAEAALTADHNAEMVEQRARYRRLRDRSVFVGNPEDVVPDPLGPGLPGIREWTEANFDFAGYVTGFEPPGEEEVHRLRARLGQGEDRRLCVVTVGGSGVGEPLLRRVLDAVPLARRQMPELHFLVVTGPRIDPASLPRRRGVSVRGYLPDLHRHLAAADLAVVQGGLTTCMELTAARRPFLYVPLRHHFEQNFHVRHRLERYEAGTCLAYEQAVDAEGLADAICKEAVREVAYRPVETDGARRAAAMLAELV